jgi:hypothetical protein
MFRNRKVAPAFSTKSGGLPGYKNECPLYLLGRGLTTQLKRDGIDGGRLLVRFVEMEALEG